MKKKLFLHVGPGKTGTSAIQSFLAYNKEVLKTFGYIYPEIDSIESSSKCIVTGGNVASLARIMLKDNHPFAINDNNLKKNIIEKLEAAIVNSINNNIILSSELLSMLNIDEVLNLKTFFDKFDYKVCCIFYLRRHDQIAESDYAQQVKKHYYTKPINDEYCNRMINNYNFLAIINNYGKIFGENSVIIRIYEKEQFTNGNILEDFLEALGILDYKEYFLFKNIIVNPSPSRAILEIMRIANEVDSEHVTTDRLLGLVYNHQEFQKKKNENYINYETKCDILNKCENVYTAIAKKYFFRDNLFFQKIEPYEMSILSNEEIVSVFIRLLQYKNNG